jgi:hypothetical protein
MALVAGLEVGCGGAVDLGGDGSKLTPGQISTVPPQPPGSAGVLHSFSDDPPTCGGLAVDDQYVYVTTCSAPSMAAALWRCPKDDCSTLTVVSGPVDASLLRLHLSGGNLAFTKLEPHTGLTGALTVCAAPDCSRLRDVLSDVPGIEGMTLDQGELFWGLSGDQAVYSCALPTCDGGPAPLSETTSSASIVTNGDTVYWIARGAIWRAGKGGAAPAEALGIGPQLRSLDVHALLAAALPYAESAFFVAVDDAWLYAVRASKNDECPRPLECSTIVRWPAHGFGEEEVVLAGTGKISDLSIVHGELIIKYMQLRPGQALNANCEIWSCRPDSCASSKRLLGEQSSTYGDPTPTLAAADDRDLYWLATAPPGAAHTTLNRAPLLP